MNAITNQAGVILFIKTVCIPPQRLSPKRTSISHGPFFTFVKSHGPPLYRATSDGPILTAPSVGYIATLSGRTGTGEDLTECEEAWVRVDALVGGLAEEVLTIYPRVCGGYRAR